MFYRKKQVVFHNENTICIKILVIYNHQNEQNRTNLLTYFNLQINDIVLQNSQI